MSRHEPWARAHTDEPIIAFGPAEFRTDFPTVAANSCSPFPSFSISPPPLILLPYIVVVVVHIYIYFIFSCCRLFKKEKRKDEGVCRLRSAGTWTISCPGSLFMASFISTRTSRSPFSHLLLMVSFHLELIVFFFLYSAKNEEKHRSRHQPLQLDNISRGLLIHYKCPSLAYIEIERPICLGLGHTVKTSFACIIRIILHYYLSGQYRNNIPHILMDISFCW